MRHDGSGFSRRRARVYGQGIVAAALAIAGVAYAAPSRAEVPFVYVRCPRTDASIEVSGEVVVDGKSKIAKRTLRGLDLYDVMPEVTHFLGAFTAPCDLVHRDDKGNERVLFDCSSSATDESTCAAMDPAVSFDAKTVAFTVFRGTTKPRAANIHPKVIDPAAENSTTAKIDVPGRTLTTTEAQLHLVDVASGKITPLPFVPNEIDSGPAFLPNGRLAFTSTRDGHRGTKVSSGTSRGTRIYTMDLDGRNVDIASHHSLAQEQHPYVLRDGRVAYSSWQLFGGLPYRYTNGAPGGFTTLDNLFHIYTQHPDGAVSFAFFGQHAGDHTPITANGVTHNAAHFLAQGSDQRVWFNDYYRGNNWGLGAVVGVMPEPEGMEGLGPHEIKSYGDVFAPRDIVSLAKWVTNGDNMSKAMPAPAYADPNYADPLVFAGKLGHPAALPDNRLLVVWGKGACSTNASNDIFGTLGLPKPPFTSGSGAGVPLNVITSLGFDNPGCDLGIYRTTKIPSEHPRDLERMVDSRDWHELMARALLPYQEIHGVPKPAIIERADKRVSRHELEVGTPFGLLGAASIIDRETHPYTGITFQGEHQFNGQGTDTIDYTDDELCGVRILSVLPNRGTKSHEELKNVTGERVRILGEFPVRKRLPDGRPRMDPSGKPDTSFLVRFPANSPYLMQGIDCDGRTLNTDQTWQSLRPGEQKTCGGCHVHSRAPRVSFDQSFAATPEHVVHRLGEGTVPLLAGKDANGDVRVRAEDGYGLRIDFEEDILPIFVKRCSSCHGDTSPAAGLTLTRGGTSSGNDSTPPSTWWCLASDLSQKCVPAELHHNTGAGGSKLFFRRPQLTRYVRAFNSRGSLLYWKAANKRTDNRADTTFTSADGTSKNDIDFGANHPTDITPDELGLIARWIDLGVPAGPGEGRDTQRPTLNLSALVEGKAVRELRVGTVDIGSGIDPSTLVVCIVDAQGECGPNLAPAAAPHGVVNIPLASPLTDLDVEVRATVRDLEGLETIVQRTVAWLIDAPPPPPAPDGGAGANGANGALPDEQVNAGCGCRHGAPPGTAGFWGLGVATAALLVVMRRARRAR